MLILRLPECGCGGIFDKVFALFASRCDKVIVRKSIGSEVRCFFDTCRGLLLRTHSAKALQPGTVTFAAFSAGLLFMKDWAKSFYKSANWKHTREYIMHRDALLCQDCLAQGIYKPAEEVHHIIELTPANVNDPSISLNPENLISLCRECHRARHGSKTVPARYTVDEFGHVTV